MSDGILRERYLGELPVLDQTWILRSLLERRWITFEDIRRHGLTAVNREYLRFAGIMRRMNAE